MDSDRLPEELRPYAQTIEAFGWDRFISRYELASAEQRETWRIAIWKADQSIESLMEEIDVDRDTAAHLFWDISHPTPPPN